MYAKKHILTSWCAAVTVHRLFLLTVNWLQESATSSPPKIGPMVQAERRVRTCSHYAETQPIDAGRAVGGGMTTAMTGQMLIIIET